MPDLIPIMKVPLKQKVLAPVGEMGALRMVKVENLVVDNRYQRAIRPRSVTRIERIAKNFDWRKFTPLIGVEVDGEKIALIDGQHRCTAAYSIGFEQLPVYIIKANLAEAAAAFAAINGDVTPIEKADLFKARVAAGDPVARRLKACFDAAGISLVQSYSTSVVGGTRAVAFLERALLRHGDETLIFAMQIVTETGNGNPGCVKGIFITGLCNLIKSRPYLIEKSSTTFEVFDIIDMATVENAAKQKVLRDGGHVGANIERAFRIHIDQNWPGGVPA